ncbi:MAG: hypothetical protein ACRCWP_09185 [Shewanella sp.]
MGKRGPKKGVFYSSNGASSLVKMVLYRRKHPNTIWVDTVRFVYPESHEMDPVDLKDSKIRSARRDIRKFERVFTELTTTKAKEWERLINGRPISKPLWSIAKAGDGQFCVICYGTDTKNQYPQAELGHKWADIVSFLKGVAIADWMLDFGLTSEELTRARDRKVREAKTAQDILDLRGDDHLHIVSILGEGAELVTKAQMFEQLEIAEQTGIAAMMAAIEKDKTKT